jgi:small-conductance mechanosensitive channel
VLGNTKVDLSTQYTIVTLFGYVVLTLGMVIALRQLVNLSALGTIVAALSVGIGFGMQDIVSNFISGIILLFERPIRVGDTIEVGSNQGRVRTINIRATTVQTLDNVFILVPNRALVSNEVVNYGYSDPKVRVSIPVGVSYGSDAEQVRDVLLKVAAEESSVMKHPVPQVQFTAFGDSALNFLLLAWIQRADQRSRITSELNFAIFAAFREAGIQIPFPQRDLHIRSAEGLAPRALPQPDPEPEA